MAGLSAQGLLGPLIVDVSFPQCVVFIQKVTAALWVQQYDPQLHFIS